MENNFKIFNEDNILQDTMDDQEYDIALQRQTGVKDGVADRRLHNKLYRQMTTMAKAIGDFITLKGYDAKDTDPALLSVNLERAIQNTSSKGLREHIGAQVMDHPAGSVQGFHLADGSVTEPKIAKDAVTTEKIKDGNIISAKLADILDGDKERDWIRVNSKGLVTYVGDISLDAYTKKQTDKLIEDALKKSTKIIAGEAHHGDTIKYKMNTRPVVLLSPTVYTVPGSNSKIHCKAVNITNESFEVQAFVALDTKAEAAASFKNPTSKNMQNKWIYKFNLKKPDQFVFSVEYTLKQIGRYTDIGLNGSCYYFQRDFWGRVADFKINEALEIVVNGKRVTPSLKTRPSEDSKHGPYLYSIDLNSGYNEITISWIIPPGDMFKQLIDYGHGHDNYPRSEMMSYYSTVGGNYTVTIDAATINKIIVTEIFDGPVKFLAVEQEPGSYKVSVKNAKQTIFKGRGTYKFTAKSNRARIYLLGASVDPINKIRPKSSESSFVGENINIVSSGWLTEAKRQSVWAYHPSWKHHEHEQTFISDILGVKPDSSDDQFNVVKMWGYDLDNLQLTEKELTWKEGPQYFNYTGRYSSWRYQGTSGLETPMAGASLFKFNENLQDVSRNPGGYARETRGTVSFTGGQSILSSHSVLLNSGTEYTVTIGACPDVIEGTYIDLKNERMTKNGTNHTCSVTDTSLFDGCVVIYEEAEDEV